MRYKNQGHFKWYLKWDLDQGSGLQGEVCLVLVVVPMQVSSEYLLKDSMLKTFHGWRVSSITAPLCGHHLPTNSANQGALQVFGLALVCPGSTQWDPSQPLKTLGWSENSNLSWYPFMQEKWGSTSLGINQGFPGGTSDQEPTFQCRRLKRCGFDLWVRKITWRRA